MELYWLIWPRIVITAWFSVTRHILHLKGAVEWHIFQEFCLSICKQPFADKSTNFPYSSKLYYTFYRPSEGQQLHLPSKQWGDWRRCHSLLQSAKDVCHRMPVWVQGNWNLSFSTFLKVFATKLQFRYLLLKAVCIS